MADFYEPDLGTVYYRSRDPIKNLKIRVTLKKVTSTSIVPQVALEKTGGPVSAKDLNKQHQQPAPQSGEETFTFSWQQKVFSQREFDKYLHEANAETVIEKKYHRTVLNTRDKGRESNRLFSYVMHDSFANHREKVETLTNDPDEKPTPLGERLANVRRRKTAVLKGKDGNNFVPKSNLVNQNPTNEVMKRNRVILTPEIGMYILADLTPTDADRPPTEEDEYLLCTIKVDANGVISMKPDFSKNRNPYRVVTEGLGRSVYEYVIECSSSQMSRQEMDREQRMYKEFYQRHSDNLKLKVGPEFEMPPPAVLRYFLNGEVVSAKNFEYDHLFVRYLVDVPQHWRADYANNLAGVTHTCKTKVENFDNVAYFSYPFELEMFYKNELAATEESETFPAWPKIYVEVCSLDSWSRFRVEGYGYCVLPQVPGSHTLTLQCWRPLGNNPVGELRRFFVGGSPELEDPTYAAIPAAFEGTHLSKYGCRTESTGSVIIKVNTLLQSQSFLQKLAMKKKRDTLFSNLGSALDYNQIKLVLDAFTKAHERMVNARENVLRDIKEMSIGGSHLGMSGAGDTPSVEDVIKVENPLLIA